MLTIKNVGKIKLLQQWQKDFSESEIAFLLNNGLLIAVAPERVVGNSVVIEMNLKNVLYEVIELDGAIRLCPVDSNDDSLDMNSAELYQPFLLCERSLLVYFRQINRISHLEKPIPLPTGFRSLGCKTSDLGARLHIITTDCVSALDMNGIVKQLELYKPSTERFVFLVEEPLKFIEEIPESLRNFIAVYEMPTLKKKLKIGDHRIYLEKFGFTFDQVVREVGAKGLVIEKETGVAYFCGKQISSRKGDLSKVLIYLAERLDSRVLIERCVNVGMNKTEDVGHSKILSNTKERFKGKVSAAFGADSHEAMLSRSVWPNLLKDDLGYTKLCSESMSVVAI
ncbi:hypothetical protein ACNH6C_14770 [Bdellovibrio bacteriovorus]|uniref:hypothetical protein n=1 Tax=Bdellovibrio bacteriovorus TaxID=959 RepID=UPI003A8104B1